MIGMMEPRGSAFDACLYPLGGGLAVSGAATALLYVLTIV